MRLWQLPQFVGCFFLDRHPKVKKPLVYTKRLWRLVAADLLLSIILFVGLGLIFAAGDAAMLMGTAAAIVIFAQPWILIAAGGLTAPLERAISRKYVREAEQMLRDNQRLTIIGITGSYGKTSVKYFLSELLSAKYHVFMTPGNFNTTLGVTRAIREGLLPTHNVFLCEMGARHPGDIQEICNFVHPHFGVITAVAPQAPGDIRIDGSNSGNQIGALPRSQRAGESVYQSGQSAFKAGFAYTERNQLRDDRSAGLSGV